MEASTMGTIVHCKTLQEGDLVRRPVSRAELLLVEAVDLDAKELSVKSLRDGDRFVMPWRGGHHWMVREDVSPTVDAPRLKLGYCTYELRVLDSDELALIRHADGEDTPECVYSELVVLP